MGQKAIAEENYCKDPGTGGEWDSLIQRHPNDMEIHTLHALRLGLCAKVDRGDLTIEEEATTIFENARDVFIQKRKAETPKSMDPNI